MTFASGEDDMEMRQVESQQNILIPVVLGVCAATAFTLWNNYPRIKEVVLRCLSPLNAIPFLGNVISRFQDETSTDQKMRALMLKKLKLEGHQVALGFFNLTQDAENGELKLTLNLKTAASKASIEQKDLQEFRAPAETFLCSLKEYGVFPFLKDFVKESPELKNPLKGLESIARQFIKKESQDEDSFLQEKEKELQTIFKQLALYRAEKSQIDIATPRAIDFSVSPSDPVAQRAEDWKEAKKLFLDTVQKGGVDYLKQWSISCGERLDKEMEESFKELEEQVQNTSEEDQDIIFEENREWLKKFHLKFNLVSLSPKKLELDFSSLNSSIQEDSHLQSSSESQSESSSSDKSVEEGESIIGGKRWMNTTREIDWYIRDHVTFADSYFASYAVLLLEYLYSHQNDYERLEDLIDRKSLIKEDLKESFKEVIGRVLSVSSTKGFEKLLRDNDTIETVIAFLRNWTACQIEDSEKKDEIYRELLTARLNAILSSLAPQNLENASAVEGADLTLLIGRLQFIQITEQQIERLRLEGKMNKLIALQDEKKDLQQKLAEVKALDKISLEKILIDIKEGSWPGSLALIKILSESLGIDVHLLPYQGDQIAFLQDEKEMEKFVQYALSGQVLLEPTPGICVVLYIEPASKEVPVKTFGGFMGGNGTINTSEEDLFFEGNGVKGLIGKEETEGSCISRDVIDVEHAEIICSIMNFLLQVQADDRASLKVLTETFQDKISEDKMNTILDMSRNRKIGDLFENPRIMSVLIDAFLASSLYYEGEYSLVFHKGVAKIVREKITSSASAAASGWESVTASTRIPFSDETSALQSSRGVGVRRRLF